MARARGRPPRVIRPESLSEPRGNAEWRCVLDGLERGWSPEIICGRRRLEMPAGRLSTETVYRFIRFIFSPEQRDQQLWRYLVRHASRRRSRKSSQSRKPDCDWGQPLDQRPQEANERSQPGHWEIDTMCFCQPGRVIVQLVERLSRYGLALLIDSREALPIAAAVKRKLASLPPQLVLA